MPSKRFHSKNRHGCIPCKRRKVKCNLVRPTCSNCARRNEVCALHPESITTTSPSPTTDRSIGPSQINSSLHPITDEPGYVTGNDSFSALRPINTDLYFLERYFSHICPTLSSRPETQRNWARRWTDASGSSKQPHYLTHLQIAISELHFCLTERDTSSAFSQRRGRLEDSVYHQNAAISILRPLLGSTVDMQTRGPEEVTALFSAAWLLFLFNLTFPRDKHANPNWILDEIVELSELSKGVVAIMIGASAAGMAPPVKSSSSSSLAIKQPLYADSNDDHTREAKARVMSGPLRAFFEPLLPWKHQDVPPSVRRQNLSASAQDLIKTIESLQTTAINNKPLYQLAIDELEMTAVAMRLHTQHPAFVFMWLVGTKRQFMELIKQRDVLALRILREYGLLLKTVESHWWARGLGRTIVEGVGMALSTLR